MTQETELTQADKATLKRDIKISLIIGLLFCVALVFIVAIVPVVLLLFGKRSSDVFVSRGLFILGLMFLPFVSIYWKNFLKYADIKKGKKLTISTADYKINKTKNSVFLLLKDNANRKIEIWEELLPLIDVTKPLKIDLAILSKKVIFISHDHKNLLHN